MSYLTSQCQWNVLILTVILCVAGEKIYLAIKGDGRHTRLLPHAKMLLFPIKIFFFCWVDYALEGSTFSLSKRDFSRMFHTKRS